MISCFPFSKIAVIVCIARAMLPSSAADALPVGSVVINEIMYHPPGDREDLQFVELFNRSEKAIDLSGWAFTKGLEFTFPKGFELPAGTFAVVCRDKRAFLGTYQGERRIAGVFKGRLSHNGERIDLVDAQQQRIDSIKYSDAPPWPLGADGYGSSLERICPSSPGDDPANWSSSASPGREQPGGTPARENSTFSPLPLPRVTEVRANGVAPNQAVTISAAVSSATNIQSVTLSWASAPNGVLSSWTETQMKRSSGNDQQGIYSAVIPAQPEGSLVRYTVRAQSASGAARLVPSTNEPRSTFSFSTFVNTNHSTIPFLQVLSLGPMPRPSPPFGRPRPRQIRPAPNIQSGQSAVIYMPPGGKEALTFDHVEARQRKGGWKIHFLKDQPLEGMTGINVIFEASPRWVLAEPLAYEVFRKAGVPAPLAHHVRLWIDRRPMAYFLLIEQPNKSFLRRNQRDERGNLYKLLWYGQGVRGQHEKKTNTATDHEDIVQIIDQLNRTGGAAQWELIQREFNVDEMASYFAVNMCIQNWDGFFNNYYAYHDLKPGGKWEMFPWDNDKTWGDYDGASWRYDWYDMPLTYGMNSDRPASRSFFGGGPFGGGAGWWRPPGWFSGPLLANPEFRKRFLARLREICETVFTPEKMDPIINSLESRLKPEMLIRAQLTGQDGQGALQNFENDIRSFRNQVVNRRKNILKQLEQNPR